MIVLQIFSQDFWQTVFQNPYLALGVVAFAFYVVSRYAETLPGGLRGLLRGATARQTEEQEAVGYIEKSDNVHQLLFRNMETLKAWHIVRVAEGSKDATGYWEARVVLDNGKTVDVNSDHLTMVPKTDQVGTGVYEWLFYPHGKAQDSEKKQIRDELNDTLSENMTLREELKRKHLGSREQMELIDEEVGARHRRKTPYGYQNPEDWKVKNKGEQEEEDEWES